MKWINLLKKVYVSDGSHLCWPKLLTWIKLAWGLSQATNPNKASLGTDLGYLFMLEYHMHSMLWSLRDNKQLRQVSKNDLEASFNVGLAALLHIY